MIGKYQVILYFIILCLGPSAFAEDKILTNAQLIANEFLEGNNKKLKEVLSSAPNYKYDELMKLLSSGESPELIAKVLEEFKNNKVTNIRFVEAIISYAEKDPGFVQRASSSLKELKPALSLKRGTALIPNHCLLFIGAYFSARDIAYSSRAFFNPGTEADEHFVYKMDKLMTVSEYLTPLMCMFDIATRRDEYKKFIETISDYKRSRSNISTLKNIVEDISVDPETVKNSRRNNKISKLTEIEKENLGHLMIEGLQKNKLVELETSSSILQKFKKFLDNKKNNKLINEYMKMLRNGKYQEVSAKMEEDFLKELVKNKSGTYEELKVKLSEARRSELKNLKPFDIPTTTKLCFAAIGGTVLTQGHIAAIGPKKTMFDNAEDEWLRDNRRTLAYLGVAAIVPTCMAKIPYFIYLVKTNQLKEGIKLTQIDYKAMNRSLERAHERFLNGERPNTKSIKKSSAGNILAKVERNLLVAYGEKEKVGGKNNSESVIQILDELKMGEEKLSLNISDALNKNDTKMFSELLESKDPKVFKSLVSLLENSDNSAAQEVIKDFKTNKFDIVKYLFELQKEVKGNPDSLKKIEQNLISIKSEMKLKNIKPPGAQACLIALGTYIGTRDLFFSIKNSYIEKELDHAWADAMDAADALTGLGITYFCLSDFIVHGKGYKSYLKNIKNLSSEKKNVQLLIDLTTSYKESPKLKKLIGRLKFIPSLDKEKVLGMAKEISSKVDEKRPVKFKNINEAWREFLFSNKMGKIFKDFKKTLTLEERINLDLVINQGSISKLEEARALENIRSFKEHVTENFEEWLKKSSKADRELLFIELRNLKQKQKTIKVKHKGPGIGTKACFWGVGTILAGLGYHAAVGNKPSELDHTFEVEQRKKTHELFLGAQAIFAGTCGANIFYAGRKKWKQRNEIHDKPFLSNKDQDWNMIERALDEYDKKVKISKPKGKFERAKDVLLKIANRQNGFKYAVDQKVKPLNGARNLKEKINRSTGNKFYLNFDKKCLENALKSVL
jgi:hypothetical protein